MGVNDDPALGGLAEDLGQAHDRHGTRGDDVGQNLPGPDRRQLIDIADEQQRRAFRQGPKDRPHQRHIDHRGLVDDQQITVQGLDFVAPEAPGPGIGFEQAMDRLRLEAGALGQALGGAAGRGAERDRDGFGDQDLQQRVDERGLADAGPAGDDHHLGDERDPERCFLAVGKRQLRPLLDPGDRLVDIDRGPGRLPNGKRLELLGDFALGSVKCGKEDATTAFEIVGNDSTVLELKAQRRFDELGRHFEQLFGEGNELFDRKTAMPFVHRLGERVGDAGTHADQRGLLDAELGAI